MIVTGLDCYGCAVCVPTCPKQLISMVMSEQGFLRPHIEHPDDCNDCQLCNRVCSFEHDEISHRPKHVVAYSAVSKDRETLNSCTSGGAGYEIARLLFNRGFRACGVRYNYELERAEHFVAATIEEYQPSKGSKYLQSHSEEALSQIGGPGKWVIFGTPCQIDSLRTYTELKKRADDYLFVDFFCHGVPTYSLWQSYLGHMRSKHGLAKLSQVRFREKRNGWSMHRFTMLLSDGEREVASKLADRDMFLSFFLSDLCLGLACYQRCKFKMDASSADIRIGDLWSKTYSHNSTGVSAVLALSPKGEGLIQDLTTQCEIKREATDVVMEGQMRSSPRLPRRRAALLTDLLNHKPLHRLYWKYVVPHKLKARVLRGFRKIGSKLRI